MIIIDGESAIGLLRGVTINLESYLTPDDVQYIWESIDAGEWGIAFEDLCTQLDEHGAKIGEHAYNNLKELGEYYGKEPSYWEVLRPEE